MKRLVIHAGLAKTGTSSIQQALGNAAAMLREQGIYYPDWQPHNHSFEMAALFRENPEQTFLYRQLAPADEAAWQAEVARLRERWQAFCEPVGPGTWIISAESLEQLQPERIRLLLEFFAPWFDEIRLVVYVREPRAAIRSRWEQGLKEMAEGQDAAQLLANAKQRGRFGGLRRWASVLHKDQVQVRLFDAARFEGGNLITDFLHACGLPPVDGLEPAGVESNVSLGWEGCALLLGLNSAFPAYLADGLNPARGMAGHMDLLYRLMRESDSAPLDFEISFSAEEAATLNRDIAWVNDFLPPTAHFEPVHGSEAVTCLPEPEDASPAYQARLFNALLKELEQRSNDLAHTQRLLQAAEQRLAELTPPEAAEIDTATGAEDDSL